VKRSGNRSEATATALLEAALEIVRESGVKSVTHRKVCSRAGVALGSSTYHYENLDALVLDAFAYYVDDVSEKYEQHFAQVSCEEELIDALVGVTTILTTDVGNAILDWELLAEAGREQAYTELARRWSHRFRTALESYVSARTAYMLEAIWDGMTIQRVLNGNDLDDADLRDLIKAALALDPDRSYPVATKPAKRPSASRRSAKV
jgi:TetR/AcrR family transcriptional regulator, regulator of biofilm formation and stress response